MIGDDRLVGTREVVERGVLGVGIASVKVELLYGLVIEGISVALIVDVGEGATNKVEDVVGVKTLNDDIVCSEEAVDMGDVIGRGVDVGTVVGIYNMLKLSVIPEPLPTSLSSQLKVSLPQQPVFGE